ncbi:WYL domain-containing protein [Solirubrobacter phytolaccae]|uniref:WYL domain-containing protein n=1 Tax=Solirubrobacter phytolaccae TaxID=1404360 RepID=A0A9X3S6T3_9ACTN|nr:transcriptional regulator [Solirubrobacter phytolaccae]MDA0179493.1 WYL domain-containing protein [Solirubrobacter phytolaccae]
MQNVPQSTSSRLLLLLGYLQSQPVWSGPDLVGLLGVTDRTLRKDIERLRGLGYPVDATRGPGGGYRLGRHGQLPPLLLSDDEAVAVAIGLGSAGVAPGLADASAAAMAKLERTLPDRLQRRVRAIHASTEAGPANTGTNEPEVPVDPDLLAQLAAAISGRDGVRFSYDGTEGPVTADPYRLVSWRQRWYLVAREQPGREWRVYRVDWMRLRFPGGARFAPAPLEGGDYAAFVLRDVASTGWKVHARILVDAPAQDVLDRINPAVGVVETVDDGHCVLVTGADTLETVAVWIGMLGIDFHVSEPPELVEHLRVLAQRYARSVPGGPG